MRPQILIDIENALKKARIEIANDFEGEGRVGSTFDESTVKKFLKAHPIIGKYILDVPARAPGDMLVVDPQWPFGDSEQMYVVNIKTSKGSCSNGMSKQGFVYAFTDMGIEEIPKRLSWSKMDKYLRTRKVDNQAKDYWYLCVDKNDSSNVVIRGAKQICNWVENSNPANMLQIDWKKEWASEPVQRNYAEAYDVIIGGIIRCIQKDYDNMPALFKPK